MYMINTNTQEGLEECKKCSHNKNGKCDIEDLDRKSVIYWLKEGYVYSDATKADCPFWWVEIDEYKKFEDYLKKMNELGIPEDEQILLLKQKNDEETLLTYLKYREKHLNNEEKN